MSDYYAETLTTMPLFNQRAPSVRGSLTSAQAADLQSPEKLTGDRRKVFEFLRTCGAFGATDEEIATSLGMSPSTARPRRIELTRRGLIVPAGTRKTAAKRNATAWRVAG
jgi:hypothetical protein